MSTHRTISVLLGLALTGMFLGALAGVAVITVVVFSLDVRQGRLEFPLSWFGSLLGALFGGFFGGVLAPTLAFSPWRRVPVGRLFAHLTIGTVTGGAIVALLFPSLGFELLGGLLGFLIAGDRLASRRADLPR